MKEAKEQLVMIVSGAVSWRFQKQEQFPTDTWNNHAALSLQALEVYLQSLPEDHPIFSWYMLTEEAENENLNEEIRVFGYQNSQDESEEFIDRIMGFVSQNTN